MAYRHSIQTAHRVLKNNNITEYPVDVFKLAKSIGIKVKKIDLDDDVSAILEPTKKEIYIRNQDHPNRQRFSLAHELGHFFLAHCDGMHIDKMYRDTKSMEGLYRAEIEANQFAAELLMPSFEVERTIKKYMDDKNIHVGKILNELAQYFKVSESAMENRLKNLGYLA